MARCLIGPLERERGRRKGDAAQRGNNELRPPFICSSGETHARCDTSLPIEDFRRVIEWIVARDEVIRDALFASLMDHYKEGREIELDCLEDEDPNVVLPEIQNSLELLPLCGLVAVHINAVLESGDPLFGIELGCNWETDRGAGARFLGLVVDSAGDADHSFIFPKPAG